MLFSLLIRLGVVGIVTRLILAQDQLPVSQPDGRRGPNIVFILTDDQDVQLNSLQYMPLVKKHLIEQGTHFSKHYCTTALCCPSRVTLWTGKTPHNTNVTDVSPPYGGYPKFVSQGFNDDYLPVWLQKAGYNTYYVGKLFNAHTVGNYNSPYPAGFTGSDFLLDPFTYDYLNSTFQRNKEEPRSYEGAYSTDIVAEKVYGFLDDAVRDLEDKNRPFFLTAAPVGPHSNVVMKPGAPAQVGEPLAAERHQHLFEDVKVPRRENFNPDHPSGANWVLDLPLQNQTNIDYNDHFYRQRLRALQAVDELVEGLVSRLDAYGILDDTYIVYSSDNGFHIGQHRLQPGKTCGYEEDIHIPLIVRGPGVEPNYTAPIGLVTSHTDLAPTFLSLLGISPLREDLDGKPIPVTRTAIEEEERREHAAVEYWGIAISEGIHQVLNRHNNTYKAVRLSSADYDLYYSVWCNNEHELYDMTVDPAQMHNLLAPTTNSSAVTVAGIPIFKVAARLDALLFVLKSCRGISCRQPWGQLHPSGDVKSLADALDIQFDAFYDDQQQHVRYEFCADGYIVDAEGPMWETHGRSSATATPDYLREGLRWEEWV